eukprot:764000-Hanusia_phi.AAC.4
MAAVEVDEVLWKLEKATMSVVRLGRYFANIRIICGSIMVVWSTGLISNNWIILTGCLIAEHEDRLVKMLLSSFVIVQDSQLRRLASQLLLHRLNVSTRLEPHSILKTFELHLRGNLESSIKRGLVEILSETIKSERWYAACIACGSFLSFMTNGLCLLSPGQLAISQELARDRFFIIFFEKLECCDTSSQSFDEIRSALIRQTLEDDLEHIEAVEEKLEKNTVDQEDIIRKDCLSQIVQDYFGAGGQEIARGIPALFEMCTIEQDEMIMELVFEILDIIIANKTSSELKTMLRFGLDTYLGLGQEYAQSGKNRLLILWQSSIRSNMLWSEGIIRSGSDTLSDVLCATWQNLHALLEQATTWERLCPCIFDVGFKPNIIMSSLHLLRKCEDNIYTHDKAVAFFIDCLAKILREVSEESEIRNNILEGSEQVILLREISEKCLASFLSSLTVGALPNLTINTDFLGVALEDSGCKQRLASKFAKSGFLATCIDLLGDPQTSSQTRTNTVAFLAKLIQNLGFADASVTNRFSILESISFENLINQEVDGNLEVMNDVSLVSSTICLLAASLYFGETICNRDLLETWINRISQNYCHVISPSGNAKNFLLILMKVEQKGAKLELESAFIEDLCSISGNNC